MNPYYSTSYPMHSGQNHYMHSGILGVNPAQVARANEDLECIRDTVFRTISDYMIARDMPNTTVFGINLNKFDRTALNNLDPYRLIMLLRAYVSMWHKDDKDFSNSLNQVESTIQMIKDYISK